MRPNLAQALVHWTQKHARVLTTPAVGAASLPDQAEALHAATERHEQQGQYWRVVQRLAAVGWTEDAVALLGLHSAWQLAYSGARNPQMLSVVCVLPLLFHELPSWASSCLWRLKYSKGDALAHACKQAPAAAVALQDDALSPCS